MRSNMTYEEYKVWNYCLKNIGYKFRRQAVFDNYIADFYCPTKKLIIEIDGSQHYDEAGSKKDEERDKYFAESGIKVIRYTNLQVNTQFKDICADIYAILNDLK